MPRPDFENPVLTASTSGLYAAGKFLVHRASGKVVRSCGQERRTAVFQTDGDLRRVCRIDHAIKTETPAAVSGFHALGFEQRLFGNWWVDKTRDDRADVRPAWFPFLARLRFDAARKRQRIATPA